MKTSVISMCALMLVSMQGASGADAQAASSGMTVARPAFTQKPVVTKEGETTRIRFAVNRETDVAIFIEDSQGKIVRHLAAGVLGTNAPAPLKSGLVQEIEWDGKADYGRSLLPSVASGEGGLRVRVALGLGAKFDRVLSRPPPNFSGTLALGVGPDGAVYVRHSDFPAIWAHSQLVVLNRDGSYRRTLIPYAATPDNREARGFDIVDLNGTQAPALVSERGPFAHLFSGRCGPGCGFAVSPDGKQLYVPAPNGIICVNTAGGIVPPLVASLEKGVLGANPAFTATASLAAAADGRRLFMTGLAEAPSRPGVSAVWQIGVPERAGLKPFFGDPKTPGNDLSHLGANPGGLAVDGRGHLLVADTANNRVVVLDERNGAYQGELKTEKPILVGTAPKAGALYVVAPAKGGLRLSKFAVAAAGAGSGTLAWPDAKPVCEVTALMRTDLTQAMAVDASADPAMIWLSAGVMGSLFRIEDRGSQFEVVALSTERGVQNKTEEGYLSIVVDRRTREVYARNGNFGMIWERFDDETGKSEFVNIPVKGSGGTGPQLVPAPNGNLYGLQWPYYFYQWDRSGKPVPFSAPRTPTDEEMKLNFPTRYKGMNNDLSKWDSQRQAYVPVAMCELPHGMGARWSDGHLFAIEPWLFSGDRATPNESCGGRIMKAMHEYLPSGQRVTTPSTPIIWKLTDAAVGPKFDAAGNIYVADIVRPRGWAFPTEFEPSLGRPKPEQILEGRAEVMAANYGSIVKFSPQGGMIHFGTSGWGAATGHDPFDGQPKFAPGLPEIEADFFYRCLKPVKITGAEWVHPGVGHVGLYGCNCENMTFDVDEFGRVFFPDFAMYQIRVIDTAGNSIFNFGRYGNADNCGPEIALAWPVGVGVTDKHAYIGDAINRRLLRTTLVYAVEESCEIR
jgi:hypothetical protein